MSVTTWFVTGASRGFGRELTGQLLARGHRVAATLRRPEQLDDLASRHQDRLWVRALDVTDTGQMRRVVAEAFADLGRVDVVVSNAGFGVFGAAEDLTDAQVEAMIATNLTASIQLARAVVPYLRGQGGGRLLQLSSMGGQIAFPLALPETAYKHSVEFVATSAATAEWQAATSSKLNIEVTKPKVVVPAVEPQICTKATNRAHVLARQYHRQLRHADAARGRNRRRLFREARATGRRLDAAKAARKAAC